MTRRPMECIDEAASGSWCIHLSYMKPNWSYIVPAPYPCHVLRDASVVADASSTHPVYRAFMQLPYSKAFSREDFREAAIPAYIGLVQHIDDQLGILFAFLEEKHLFDTTMIVFTSDHGDYLSGHWLGEEEFVHDPTLREPVIVYDPRRQADGTRGTLSAALVEAIDLLTTFIEFSGGDPPLHRLHGPASGMKEKSSAHHAERFGNVPPLQCGSATGLMRSLGSAYFVNDP